MKTIFQKILFLPLLMMIFSGGIAFAQTSASSCPQKDAAGNCLYTELAPLPGTYLPEGCAGNFVGPLQPGQTTPGCQTTLQTYLPGLFNFGIAIAGLMAFVVITFAGLKYVTVETIYGKSDARELLENALWGLLLVIAAWVILNTINPGILNFNLSMQPPPATTSATPSATGSGHVPGRARPGRARARTSPQPQR